LRSLPTANLAIENLAYSNGAVKYEAQSGGAEFDVQASGQEGIVVRLSFNGPDRMAQEM
jgi:hypothetical protein